MLYVVNKLMLCNLVDFKGFYAVLARIEICCEIRVFVLFCTLFPSLMMMMMLMTVMMMMMMVMMLVKG